MNHVLRQPVVDERTGSQPLFLGPLELEVMKVVWECGASSVREVARQMQRELAYTTIMTTLDRLYKKGLLEREMSDRAFVYAAKVSREEWDRQRAGEMMSGFLTGTAESRHLLLSYLVDAVGSHDAMLLDELERRVQRKREELAKANQG